MRIRRLLQSYIGKRVVLTSSELAGICGEWEVYSSDDEPLHGDGMVNFAEHPVNDDRYRDPFWVSVSNICFDIVDGKLTLAEPGIELYPDPGRWKLDPESAWTDEDLESAVEFMNKLTGEQSKD